MKHKQDTRQRAIWRLPAATALAFDRYGGAGCHHGNYRGSAPTRHYDGSWYRQGSQREGNHHAQWQPVVRETGAAGHHFQHSERARMTMVALFVPALRTKKAPLQLCGPKWGK